MLKGEKPATKWMRTHASHDARDCSAGTALKKEEEKTSMQERSEAED